MSLLQAFTVIEAIEQLQRVYGPLDDEVVVERFPAQQQWDYGRGFYLERGNVFAYQFFKNGRNVGTFMPCMAMHVQTHGDTGRAWGIPKEEVWSLAEKFGVGRVDSEQNAAQTQE